MNKQILGFPTCSTCRIDPYGCCEFHSGKNDEKINKFNIKSKVSNLMLKIRPVFGYSINFFIAAWIVTKILEGK